jgi:hypothetical protein
MQAIQREEILVTTQLNRIDPVTAGFAAAIFLVVAHTAWAAVVALGWGQGVLNFLYNIHFIMPAYIVTTFQWTNAAMLIGVNAVAGFVMAYAFAALYNTLAYRRA